TGVKVIFSGLYYTYWNSGQTFTTAGGRVIVSFTGSGFSTAVNVLKMMTMSIDGEMQTGSAAINASNPDHCCTRIESVLSQHVALSALDMPDPFYCRIVIGTQKAWSYFYFNENTEHHTFPTVREIGRGRG